MPAPTSTPTGIPSLARSPNSASILAIGTEITTGQILNRNAPSISERLARLGIETVLHECVPDGRKWIASALDHCSSVSKLVVVTGGLGPTSDDFTRDVIADWAKAPLEFDALSWERIEAALKARWSVVPQSNRRQCWFPRGSTILSNPIGTACGFLLELPEVRLVVLPGPPREVEAVWNANDLDTRAASWVPASVPLELRTWQCLGRSEAELAELTDAALEGSGLTIGYRAHRPFVEVKVWIPRTPLAQGAAAPYLQKLETAIGPWIASRQGVDLAQRWLDSLQPARSLEVFDFATGGIFIERCAETLRKMQSPVPGVALHSVWESQGDLPNSPVVVLQQSHADIVVLLQRVPDVRGRWVLAFKNSGKVRVETLDSPFDLPGFEDRHQLYVAEWSLKLIGDWCQG